MHYLWLLTWDFNQILPTTEEHSTCNVIYGLKAFKDALFYNGLIKLRSTRVWFTQMNNKDGSALVMEKLDKTFCNEASNHGPMLIEFAWICGSQTSTILMKQSKLG